MDPYGADPAQVTSLRSTAQHPRWSPDGQRLAFTGRAPGENHNDIYVIQATGGEAHRLTEHPSNELWPTWSHDGQWVYFTSNRTGPWQTWKVPAGGGLAVQVAADLALKPRASRDGQFLFYADGPRAVWRLPLAGGEPVLIFEFPQRTDWGGDWIVADGGLFFLNRNPSRQRTLEWFDFRTRRTTQLFALPGAYDAGSGFAVSPDGAWLLFPQRDFVKSEIMMMDVDR
jgi:dipeptidyl aminopeptidase/acylaminoacyl peptidase